MPYQQQATMWLARTRQMMILTMPKQIESVSVLIISWISWRIRLILNRRMSRSVRTKRKVLSERPKRAAEPPVVPASLRPTQNKTQSSPTIKQSSANHDFRYRRAMRLKSTTTSLPSWYPVSMVAPMSSVQKSMVAHVVYKSTSDLGGSNAPTKGITTISDASSEMLTTSQQSRFIEFGWIKNQWNIVLRSTTSPLGASSAVASVTRERSRHM
mmetsp:Transcript_118853/g.336223  ORF Transcript_118853/g.336223 Transcript_118853/m.336223 type:complete len:213 (-) Transcript_118853:699-1337(-)